MSERMERIERLETLFRAKGEFHRREDGTLEFPAISLPWQEYRELAAAAEERDEALRPKRCEVCDSDLWVCRFCTEKRLKVAQAVAPDLTLKLMQECDALRSRLATAAVERDQARQVARTALDCTPGGYQEKQLRAVFGWLNEE